MSYHKPTLEHLEQEYPKAVPFLTISEKERAKRELTKEKVEHERNWKDMRLEVLSLKDENRELRERYLRKEQETETLKVRGLDSGTHTPESGALRFHASRIPSRIERTQSSQTPTR